MLQQHNLFVDAGWVVKESVLAYVLHCVGSFVFDALNVDKVEQV